MPEEKQDKKKQKNVKKKKSSVLSRCKSIFSKIKVGGKATKVLSLLRKMMSFLICISKCIQILNGENVEIQDVFAAICKFISELFAFLQK